jgi:hypothetical protein
MVGEGEGLEREPHHHPDGDADEYLLNGRERAGSGEDRQAGRDRRERS